jgi:hypothetical protein
MITILYDADSGVDSGFSGKTFKKKSANGTIFYHAIFKKVYSIIRAAILALTKN